MLSDQELRELAGGNEPVIDISKPHDDSSDAQIQPASIDLTIGGIYLPQRSDNEAGAKSRPKTSHSLKPGDTAIVESAETLAMPSSLGGLAFPPDSLSNKALVMTNPGHVDPGYKGVLKFTIINMGNEPFRLKSGHPIATLILFKLSKPSIVDWSARHDGAQGPGVTEIVLESLSKDFGAFERRAREVANKAILKTGVLALAFTLAAVAAGFVPSYVTAVDRASEARERVAILEQRIEHLSELLNLRTQSEPPAAPSNVREP